MRAPLVLAGITAAFKGQLLRQPVARVLGQVCRGVRVKELLQVQLLGGRLGFVEVGTTIEGTVPAEAASQQAPKAPLGERLRAHGWHGFE